MGLKNCSPPRKRRVSRGPSKRAPDGAPGRGPALCRPCRGLAPVWATSRRLRGGLQVLRPSGAKTKTRPTFWDENRNYLHVPVVAGQDAKPRSGVWTFPSPGRPRVKSPLRGFIFSRTFARKLRVSSEKVGKNEASWTNPSYAVGANRKKFSAAGSSIGRGFRQEDRWERPQSGCSGNQVGLLVGRAVSFWGQRHGEPCFSSG